MIADKPISDVTVADIDERFASGTWTAAGGNLQSLAFAVRGLGIIHGKFPSLMKTITRHNSVLLDYGCAMGDGTAALAALLPIVNIHGCDISPEAIHIAQIRWPTLKFFVDDVRHPQHRADTIWCSHTLEHIADPALAIRELRKKCETLIVLVPPIKESPIVGPHVGAVPTDEWLEKLSEPIFQFEFDNWRREVPEKNEICLVETSRLLVWEGL